MVRVVIFNEIGIIIYLKASLRLLVLEAGHYDEKT
jgi:hypothetical protein